MGSLTHRHTGKPAWQPRSTFTIDWSPHTQASVKARVVVSELSTPAEVQPNTRLFLEPELTLTLEASNIARVRIKTPSDACADAKGHHHSTQQARQENWFYSLPFQRFQALLTLFSKSFSPFPHGTCLLSVSNQYLALDEIYHPICAPIPRNVTLRTCAVHGGLQMTNGTLTLIDALFQEAYICASAGNAISRLQFKARGPNFHAELIPVHSPLLRESYLVSYPPLTYMLKFSGFADLTSCLE